MDIEQMYEFTATKKALESLQRLLFCCQCEQLTRNVCTLGNCEHFFCKRCVEEQLGSSCPVCETPAHARDAQVNKQLSNIVSVSLELARLLHAPLGGNVDAKGEDQAEKEPNVTAGSALDEATEQNTASSPSNSSPRLQEAPAVENEPCTPSPDVNQNPPDQLPHKAARRNSRRKTHQTTLTQICDEQLTDGEVSMGEDVQTGHSAQEKVQTPRTRMRNRQNPSSSQKKTKRTTRKSSVESGEENPSSVNETRASDVEVSTEVNNITVNQQSSPLPSSTCKRKGRQNLVSPNNPTLKKSSEMVDAPGELFKTPTPPRSGRRHGGSPQVHVNSTPPAATGDDDDVVTSTSRTPSSRRRSAPVTPIQKTPQSKEATPQRGRRSLPLTPSSVPKTGVSKLCHASPVSKKSSRKSSDGVVTRVKRNAKGETPLHVAAIKGDVTAVRELLNRGSNPNVRDNAGWTPLHEAVNHGHTAVAEILLQHGAMVNTPGMDNDTPLHDAVTNQRLPCVYLLVSYGASVTARNIHGKTALELAGTDDMRAALLQPSVQPPIITTLPEPEDSEEFRPLCFLGTALSRDQRGLLQKCATKLHAKIVEDYCPEVTHVVSSVNGQGQCPRTLKYLQAVLGGKWIVSIDWISICMEYGQKVSEEPFEVPGSSTHPHSNAANKARVNRKLQLPGLFDGCQVYLHGSFSQLPPSKAELTSLLHIGGAHLLTREPRLANLDEYEVTVPYHAAPGSSIADCGIFIVHDGGSSAPNLQAQRIQAVPASWIVECIATFSLPEPESVLN